jgi:DNA invertase Pin-like site-specific DNA recombinase
MSNRPTIRCAIYTRKSTEEGLEQDFNSLHAQREACEAFIKSQRHEGWTAVPTKYDDGGYSGGSMERPALKRLLADIAERKVDIIVVYKVDRLTRSLADFAKMVESFDSHGVSFVSVTQQFNTTTSMGRLTLNVLLSFAQFEREVTGERIRDKITASKKKGMWMGGMPPPGYRVKKRKLVIHKNEAAIVRKIFSLYLKLKNTSALYRKLQSEKIVRPKATTNSGYRYGGGYFSRGALRLLLSNPLYVGEVRHGGQTYLGQHQAIIDKSLWIKVQQILASTSHDYKIGKNATEPSLLAGLLQDASGNLFKSDHSRKGSKRYRYYSCNGASGPKAIRLPASELERALLSALVRMLQDKAKLIRLFNLKRSENVGLCLESAKKLAAALRGGLPHEKRNILLQLLKRVVFKKKSLTIELKPVAFLEKPAGKSKAISVDVPISIKQRGVETRLIIEGETEAPAYRDPALIKTLARAISWFDDLASGRVKDFSDLGTQEGLTRSVVGRTCLLAFLAPELIEQMLAGRQPLKMRARNLLREISIPDSWNEQRNFFAA